MSGGSGGGQEVVSIRRRQGHEYGVARRWVSRAGGEVGGGDCGGMWARRQGGEYGAPCPGNGEEVSVMRLQGDKLVEEVSMVGWPGGQQRR